MRRHGAAGFDGTESAPTDAYADRRNHIPGTGIDVYDDRPTCVHAGFCGNRVANVWRRRLQPTTAWCAPS